MTQIKFVLFLSFIAIFLSACGDPVQLYQKPSTQQQQTTNTPPPTELTHLNRRELTQNLANPCPQGLTYKFVNGRNLCVLEEQACTTTVTQGYEITTITPQNLVALNNPHHTQSCNTSCCGQQLLSGACNCSVDTDVCTNTLTPTRQTVQFNPTGGCVVSHNNPCLQNQNRGTLHTLNHTLPEPVTETNQKYVLNIIVILSHWLEESKNERVVRAAFINAFINLITAMNNNQKISYRILFTSTYLYDYPTLIGSPWNLSYGNDGQATPVLENSTVQNITSSGASLFEVLNYNLYKMTFCIQCTEDNPLVALKSTVDKNLEILETGDLAFIIITPTDEYPQRDGTVLTAESISNFVQAKRDDDIRWSNKLITMNGIIHHPSQDNGCESLLRSSYGEYDFKKSSAIRDVITDFGGAVVSICKRGDYYAEALHLNRNILHPDANPTSFTVRIPIDETHQILNNTIILKAKPSHYSEVTLRQNQLNLIEENGTQYVEVPYSNLPLRTSEVTLEYYYEAQPQS